MSALHLKLKISVPYALAVVIFVMLQALQVVFGTTSEMAMTVAVWGGDVLVVQWLLLIHHLGVIPSIVSFVPLAWDPNWRRSSLSAICIGLANALAEVVRNHTQAYAINGVGLAARTMIVNFSVVMAISLMAYLLMWISLRFFINLFGREK